MQSMNSLPEQVAVGADAARRQVRLALVRQRYNPYGGAERFVERALAALRHEALQVTLVTRSWPESDKDNVIRCAPFHFGNVWRDWSFARCVQRVLQRRRFDLVQSHERIAGCDIYRAGDGVHLEWLRARRADLGRVERLGTYLNPYHWYTLGAERKMFNDPRLRAVICNSRMVRDEVRRIFALPYDKLHVIYNGIDIAHYTPQVRSLGAPIRDRLNIATDDVVFLFVGSGFARKGLAAAIIALPAHAHLIVVGKDRKEKYYRRLAEQHGKAVHFAGGQADVRPYYGAADAFVLPTLYEPFSSTVLEAMACGLPVITTPRNGASELIEHGVHGHICHRPGGPALHELMNQLCDRSTRERMGAAAETHAQAFGLDAMIAQLQQLYTAFIREVAQ